MLVPKVTPRANTEITVKRSCPKCFERGFGGIYLKPKTLKGKYLVCGCVRELYKDLTLEKVDGKIIPILHKNRIRVEGGLNKLLEGV